MVCRLFGCHCVRSMHFLLCENSLSIYWVANKQDQSVFSSHCFELTSIRLNIAIYVMTYGQTQPQYFDWNRCHTHQHISKLLVSFWKSLIPHNAIINLIKKNSWNLIGSHFQCSIWQNNHFLSASGSFWFSYWICQILLFKFT